MRGRSLDLADAEESSLFEPDRVTKHSTLRVTKAMTHLVHLPADADTPELMISRLRAIDRGRHHFSKRVKKEPEKLRPEELTPIVSGNITEADAFGTQADLA